MKHLASLLAILLTSLSLTAQNELWTYDAPRSSFIVGLTLLENGNLLQGSMLRDTIVLAEINPADGTSTDEKKYPLEFDAVYFDQHAADTLLVVSEEGVLWALDRNDDTLARVAQLFPALEASGNYFRVARAEQIDDTLLTYTYDYTDDHLWEARSIYTDGSVSSTATDLGFNTVSQWQSGLGHKATFTRTGAEQFALTVEDPAGTELLTLAFPATVQRIVKAIFRNPDRLYVLGKEQREDFLWTAVLFDVDVTSGTYQRIAFTIPNPDLVVTFENMRLIDGDLVIVGGYGRGNVSRGMALALDVSNEEIWRFLPPLRPDFAFISDVLAKTSKPDDLYFCGDTGYTDVGAIGNAFTMGVDVTVTSVFVPPIRPLHFYPNPVDAQITIADLPAGVRNIELIDLAGRVITRSVAGRTVDVWNLPAGTYFVRAEATAGRFLGMFVKR